VICFISLLFVGLALIPAGAHFAELPNKLKLSRDDYFIVQQIYRGWWLWGIVILPALLSTFYLTLISRPDATNFRLSLLTFICILATQVIFWLVTFPTNQATANWIIVTTDWAGLRQRCELSHAASGFFNLVALVLCSYRCCFGITDSSSVNTKQAES
jgi:hypothetical protein